MASHNSQAPLLDKDSPVSRLCQYYGILQPYSMDSDSAENRGFSILGWSSRCYRRARSRVVILISVLLGGESAYPYILAYQHYFGQSNKFFNGVS